MHVSKLSIVFCAFALTAQGAMAAGEPDEPAYIVLGDSIDLGTGAPEASGGWSARFAAHLDETLGRPVRARNHAVSGAVLQEILDDQLPQAVQEVAGHPAGQAVISIGGGGNDLLRFMRSEDSDLCRESQAKCLPLIADVLDRVEHRFNAALEKLRRAGGPEAVILVRTQYNPLYREGCEAEWRELAHATLEGAPDTPLERGLNDRLRAVALRQKAQMIEVYDVFRTEAEAMVDADCAHPSEAGHAAIFAAAAGELKIATLKAPARPSPETRVLPASRLVSR